jgi:lysozyme
MMWFPFASYFKKKNMFGIDVSHHNGVIDWAKVATHSPKVDFAIIKASTGVGSSDPKCQFNATQAKKNGIKIGYYHYASLNSKDEVNDAKKEALWFTSVIKNYPIPDLPLVLDLEDDNPKVQLDDGEVLNWVRTFFDTLYHNGYPNYVLYSYTPFLDTHLPLNHDLGDIKLWIAQYTSKPTPRLPKGWDKYWVWQYSAKGSITGIRSDTDLNRTIQPIV